MLSLGLFFFFLLVDLEGILRKHPTIVLENVFDIFIPTCKKKKCVCVCVYLKEKQRELLFYSYSP